MLEAVEPPEGRLLTRRGSPVLACIPGVSSARRLSHFLSRPLLWGPQAQAYLPVQRDLVPGQGEAGSLAQLGALLGPSCLCPSESV